MGKYTEEYYLSEAQRAWREHCEKQGLDYTWEDLPDFTKEELIEAAKEVVDKYGKV